MSARKFFQAVNWSEVSSTSSSVWTTALTLDFTPASGEVYAVFWSLLAAKSVTNVAHQYRVTVNGTVFAAGQARMRSTDEIPTHSAFFFLTGDGSAKSVVVEFKHESGTNTTTLSQIKLAALALAPGDLYVESTARATTNGTTAATLATLDQPALAGDYLILASSLTDNSSSTVPVIGQLNVGGASGYDIPHGHAIGTDVRPILTAWKRNLAADGDLEVTWSGRGGAAGQTGGWASNRILALRLSGFDAHYYGELTADNTGTSTAWENALTVAGSASANDHLLISTINISNEGTLGNTNWLGLEDTGEALDYSGVRNYSVTVGRSTNQAFISHLAGIPEASREWIAKRYSAGAFNKRMSAGAALVVLDLGSPATTDDLLAGAMAVASPVLASPSIGQRHALAGAAWAAGSPSLGATSLGQIFALAAASLAVGAIAVGAGALGQTHVITGAAVAVGSPAFGAGGLGQTQVLSAGAFATATPASGNPALSQAHGLVVGGQAVGAPFIGAPALSQTNTLAAAELVVGAPVIGQASALPTHTLQPDTVAAGAPVFGSVTLGQRHALQGAPTAAGVAALDSPAIGQVHALPAAGVVWSSAVLGQGQIAQSHVLAAASSVVSSPGLGAAYLAQRHELGAAAATVAAPDIGAASMRQPHDFAGVGVVAGQPVVAGPEFAQRHALAGIAASPGAPVSGSAQMAQSHALLAAWTIGDLELGAPQIAQSHVLSAGETAVATIVLGEPTMATVGRSRRRMFILG